MSITKHQQNLIRQIGLKLKLTSVQYLKFYNVCDSINNDNKLEALLQIILEV